ncbi:MAG: hypothetical protein ABSD67_07060 [Terracidiphilus sp.]
MKFGVDGWSQVAIVFIWAVSWFTERHSTDSGIIGFFILIVIVPSLLALSRYFVYWDLNSHRLRERCFWSKKELTWDKVTRVSKFLPGVPWDRTVAVWYVNPSSRSGSSYIVVNPAERQQFISELQGFAVNATFEV